MAGGKCDEELAKNRICRKIDVLNFRRSRVGRFSEGEEKSRQKK